MAEKILNTRIILKHDDLATWNSSSLVLKTGEIALAKVSVKKTDPIKNTTIEVPTYLMKVGDGTSTFGSLNWVAATAADVYDWAKKESLDPNDLPEIPLAKIPEAVRQGIDTDLDTRYSFEIPESGDNAGKLVIKSTLYNKGVAGATSDVASLDFVTPSELEAIFVTKDYATKAEAQGYANAKDSAIAEAKKAGDDAAAALETYKGEMTTALGDKADKSALAEVKSTADGAAADITTMKDGATITTFAGIEAELAKKDTIESVNKKVADALAEAKEYADDNDDNTEYHVEYDSVNKKIKLVAGADASKMEIPTDDFIKDGMISSVVIDEATQELVITWNTDAGIDETRIKLSELADIYTGVDGTTVKVEVSADDKISAEVKEGSIESKHLAAAAGILKSQLENDVQTSLGLADSALQKADITSGSANGTIAVDGADVAVTGLGSMAYETAADYKKVQTAVSKTGSTTQTITSITQNEQGVIDVTYGNISIDASQVDIDLPELVLGKGNGDFESTSDAGENATISLKTEAGTEYGTPIKINGAGDISVGAAADGNYISIGTSYESLNSSVAATAEADNQVSVLTGVTQANGKLTAKTEVKLAAIAKTGNVNDLIQTTGDVLVFDCGTSSTVI